MTTTLLEDVFSILSDFKAGKETHWKDDYGIEITIEPTNVKRDRYILRRYYANGNKAWEIEYAGGLLDGSCKGWNENGELIYDEDYGDGVYRSA